MQQHTLFRVCSVLLCCVAVAPAAAELTPQQVAVVVNRSSRESIQVGHHYAKQRGVPDAQVIPLELGAMKEVVSRQEYEQKIVHPLRQTLENRGLARQIRALVTVYGLPLTVYAPQPTDQERLWTKDAQKRYQHALHDLQALAKELTVDETAPDATSEQPQKAAPLLERIQKELQERATHLSSEQESPKRTQEARDFARLVVQVGGQAELLQALRPASTAVSQQGQAELAKFNQHMATIRAMLEALRAAPSDTNRQRAYRIAEAIFGLQGVLRFAALESETFRYADGDASIDSELSLLWMDPVVYRIAGRSANPLHYTMPVPPEPAAPGFPMLMVSRLDAPTPALAMQMVDRAIAAEHSGLNGTVYIDTRGIHAPPTLLSTAAYDQNMRELAGLFRRVTSYPVVLEETDRTFNQPGEAPNVAVYVGWYRYRAYEDAFTFNPGALGYHIASGEAVSVHAPHERGWCKNALERGITATLGPNNEPYLDAFPLPGEFFGLLLTGKYSLVEAYYLTTRYVSWRMILFGDPLYNPWRGKNLARVEHITLQPVPGKTTVELPIGPAERPFPDPLPAMQQWRQRQDALLAQVDVLLHELARREAAERTQPAPEPTPTR